MTGFKGVLLNAVLAAAVTTGFAVAQDAPPPPDSQYPATNDSGQYATQDSTTMPQQQQAPPPLQAPAADQPEEGGYPQTAQSAPPASQDDRQYDNRQTAQNAPPPPQGDQGQSTLAPDDSQDPSRRVARMQFMDGQVSIQPGGVNDWVAGSLNRPMTTGDNVWTDKNSKAELNVGTGVFRMGAETSVTIANVADNATQLQVHQGTLNLRVRHLYDGETYEIDTPNTAFTISKPGDYRFDVDPNADTSYVTVWKGEGNAAGDGPSVEVRQGERAKFSNGTSMAYHVDRAPGYDQFDEWAMARDRHDDNSVSAKYVSPDVIGSSDLDDYGSWRRDDQYGNVWVPNNVGDDWEPYSDGNWMYQGSYGWTWVGYEPWGFAPYHYGRWVYGGWGWGWAPGPYSYWGAPYYAPALVSWYGGWGGGWGGGWNIGVGFGGGWGWCALGWGEPYYPWYRHGRSYFNNVNIRNTRITNITNIYNNYYYNNKGTGGGGGSYGYRNGRPANFQRGLVVAKGNAVTHGMPIRNNRLTVNNQQRNALLQHPVSARNVGAQLRPTQEARIGAQARGRAAVAPPARVTQRPTFSRNTPPQVNRGGATLNARGNANVNRPSAALNNGRSGMTTNGGRTTPQVQTSRNIPRPPNGGAAVIQNGGARQVGPSVTPGQGRAINRGNAPSTSANGHFVPRPPSASTNGMSRPGGSTYSRPGQSYSAPQAHNVPRPTGPVQQAPRSYSTPSTRSYSNPSYGRGQSYNTPNYGRSQSYSSPSYGRSQGPSYGSQSYGRGQSYNSPNYSRNYSSPSYGRPSQSYSSPSYGRGQSYGSAPRYSAPSAPHYSAPSYGGGGGHASAPSYHGGGGGYSGGGGGHYSGGGGGHSSGGGGGHASNNGGGHSGHH